MTTRSKILFYACQIAVIYSTPGGRWWCDIHSRSQLLPLLRFLIDIQPKEKPHSLMWEWGLL